jgi:hypothetical protein
MHVCDILNSSSNARGALTPSGGTESSYFLVFFKPQRSHSSESGRVSLILMYIYITKANRIYFCFVLCYTPKTMPDQTRKPDFQPYYNSTTPSPRIVSCLWPLHELRVEDRTPLFFRRRSAICCIISCPTCRSLAWIGCFCGPAGTGQMVFDAQRYRRSFSKTHILEKRSSPSIAMGRIAAQPRARNGGSRRGGEQHVGQLPPRGSCQNTPPRLSTLWECRALHAKPFRGSLDGMTQVADPAQPFGAWRLSPAIHSNCQRHNMNHASGLRN